LPALGIFQVNDRPGKQWHMVQLVGAFAGASATVPGASENGMALTPGVGDGSSSVAALTGPQNSQFLPFAGVAEAFAGDFG
jgi:hypothetical protein